MVKSAKERIDKYKGNIDPETTARYLESQKAAMIRKESKYIIEITAIEGKIRGLLQNEGVYPFDFANYLFFGRELYKLTSKYPFETALSQANIMAYKWFSKGLNEVILKKIGKLFSLTLDFAPIIILTGNAQITDVLKDKTFYNTDASNKLTGISDLKKHEKNENSTIGTVAVSGQTIYRETIAPNGTLTSCSITITKRCLVSVIAFYIKQNLPASTKIMRNSVDKTSESYNSLPNFSISGCYGIIQCAYEILEAGTYEYILINSAAINISIRGSAMKIITIEFG